MRIIDEPTCLPEGENYDLLLTQLKPELQEVVKPIIAALVQEAFTAGIHHSGPVAPVHKPVAVSNGAVPEYRDNWQEIDIDGPTNPIEQHIYYDMQHPDSGGNPEGFNARLEAALAFAAQH